MIFTEIPAVDSKGRYKLSETEKHCWGVKDIFIRSGDKFGLYIDSPMSYKQNKEELEADGWTKESITYYVDKYQFRTRSPDGQPIETGQILALGCSNTWGVGMPHDDIWCSIVADELGLDVVNLGVPAGSMDSMFRVLRAWIGTYKPKHIFVQAQGGSRREIVDYSTKIHRLMPSHSGTVPIAVAELLLTSETEFSLNYDKNLRAIKSLAQEHGATVNVLRELTFYDEQINPKTPARDLQHPGIKQNAYFAKAMLHEFNILNG